MVTRLHCIISNTSLGLVASLSITYHTIEKTMPSELRNKATGYCSLTSIGPFEQTLKHLLNWADRSKAMATDHVTIQTELLQAGIYIIYYYSQNSDHVKLQLDADHRRAACYVLSATVIGTAPNCNTNKC